MEKKTKINAEAGKQELVITREFDLPLELLFKAHAEPEIIEQWMSHEYSTMKVLKFEPQKHGSWRYETSDMKGNVVLRMNGTFHEFVENERFTRTFEMENGPFGVQLEFFEFERLTDSTSSLKMHIVYKSVALRDQMLQLPFAQGLNMAHNRLEEVVNKLK